MLQILLRMFEFFQSKTKRLQNKIDKYISIEREQDVIKSSIDELAEAFQDRKVARDSIMKSQSDDEIKKSVESRYDRFITSHLKEIGNLRRRRDDVEKSLNNLIKGDEEFVGLVEKEKENRKFRSILSRYRDEEIELSVCDTLLKAVTKNKVKYSDNLVFNEKGQLLLLKRSEVIDFMPGHFALPGGHVDPGEDFETAAKRELFEESGIKSENLLEVGCFENNDVHIVYYRTDVVDIEPVLEEEEAWSYVWVDPTKLDECTPMMDNMRDNIVKILYPEKYKIITIKKSFESGEISESVKDELIGVVFEKAKLHKYIKKELKDGEWVYTYRDTKVRTKLEKVLQRVGAKIVKLKYEHGYGFDENGNELFNHTDFNKRFVDLSAFKGKLKNSICIHNHPCNNELSINDIDICLSSQMKETRSISLDSQYGEGTYVMKNDLKEPFNMKDYVEELKKSYGDWYDNKQETHKNGWIDVFKLSSFFEEIKDSVHFSFEKDNGEVIKL